MIILLIADGRSIHTQRWAEYFAEKGHTVHLATYDPVNRAIPGVTEHVLASRWENLYLAFIPRQLAIMRLAKRIRPDIIHAHFIAKYGFHLPGLNGCPRIVSAWGDDVLILPVKSRLIRWYTARILGMADLVYAVSENIRQRVIADFSIPQQKVKYLPFGIDTDLFRPEPDRGNAGGAEATITVFSNRGYFPVYDMATLVRGFAAAHGSDQRLRLVLKGDGPGEQEIRNLVAALGIADVVTFLPRTAYADVPRDYRSADIFITTSVSDGTPVSLLESMASGLPTIATRVGGIPEWIESGRTGILIPPRDPREVTRTLLALASDPALRTRLGTEARRAIVAKGQWNTLMEQAEKDYLALIETYNQDRP